MKAVSLSWLDLSFYTTPMARQKIDIFHLAMGVVYKARSNYFQQAITSGDTLSLQITVQPLTAEKCVHCACSEQLACIEPSVLPQWRGKKSFLPRHWGSIEGQVQPLPASHNYWRYSAAVL